MDLHNSIADISLKKFASLPKTGKPNPQEWTILSTIVLYDKVSKKLEVLSLGTGSKCIGRTFMSPNGDILNDSHAEVICRRAFMKYIYSELNNLIKTNESEILFKSDDLKISIKPNLSFHLFSSHMPCGDASIFPKNDNEDFGNVLEKNFMRKNEPSESKHDKSEEDPSEVSESECSKSDLDHLRNASNNSEDKNQFLKLKRVKSDLHIGSPSDSLDGNNGASESKRIKFESDIHRTGAKCLEGDKYQDPKKTGAEFHVVGVVRTKPGRGDPTLSVSCSDKLLKWTILGLQGALLFKILQKPIYLSSITIAKNTPFSHDSLKRAISDRILDKNCFTSPFEHNFPQIWQSEQSFEFSKDPTKNPSPSSIIWFRNCKKIEVAVEGRKQGITKKNRGTKTGRLSICKKNLFEEFCELIKNDFFDLGDQKNYYDWKNEENCPYVKTWNQIKNEVFRIWPSKDKNLLMFSFE